jgi:hypothetical protein
MENPPQQTPEEQKTLQELFSQFIKEKAENDYEFKYCLIQSSVEEIVRFKFGAWLSNQTKIDLHINLLEVHKIDLVVGISNDIYLIEFGHLLNILKHNKGDNDFKIKDDIGKLDGKLKALRKKIGEKDFNGKNLHLITCSLFTDIKLEKKENKEYYESIYKINRNLSGCIYKYGRKKETHEYFEKYSRHITSPEESKDYLFGYNEVKVVKDEISIHYKWQYHKTIN